MASIFKKIQSIGNKKNKRVAPYVLAAVLLVSMALFYFLLTAPLSGFVKGLLAIALLLLTGQVLRAITKADGLNGLILVRLKEGFNIVDGLRRLTGNSWARLCDIGLVLSFGAVSGVAFKHISRGQLIVSLLLLVAFIFIVLPYLSPIIMILIDVPPLSTESATTDAFNIVFVAMVVFGLVGLVVYSLLANAIKIALLIGQFILGNSSAIATISPGVSPIIPGINLPLLEGIIALVIIMIVHEGGHGIAARLAKIRINSTGIITAGWLPIGAFVDINEKQLDKMADREKARVAVAGSTANFVTCFLFFIPTVILLWYLPAFYDNKVIVIGLSETLAAQGLENRAQIIAMNDTPITNISTFSNISRSLGANKTVTLTTDKGNFTVNTTKEGTLGMIVSQPVKSEFWYFKSLFAILGLTTVLNFLVGVINLLPLPSFDGHRLFQVGLRNKKAVSAVMWIVIIAFLLNLAPWLWR